MLTGKNKYMQVEIKRIALIGPESSGKTTLAKELAVHYKTEWVPEFARNYILNLKRKYTYDDVLYCIKQQLATEAEAITIANRFVFADTELILHKIWLWDVYGTYPPELEVEINRRQYDLYLLMAYDLPFETDPVRENPQRRDYFYNLYKQELDKRGFQYKIISGTKRFENAVKVIDETFTQKF
jgi:NadR type nicotinamide-nucleotide adenylyltransferase